MNSVMIKNKLLEIPIIQGGMGVGVSLSHLAGNVMKNGGMGVLSMAHPGYRNASFNENNLEVNLNAFGQEVKKARDIAGGRGLLGVNIMAALRNFEAYVKKAVETAVDAIIVGAGLPLDLPKYVKDDTIALAPIVSSGRAAKLIMKAWDRHYQRTTDFIVIEGPLAGGHLGFKAADLEASKCQSLEEILLDVKKEVAVYEEQYQQKIPIFVAGGIYDGVDIARFMNCGADGVQIGTRFIATDECDASQEYKQVLLDADEEDIVFVKSPVGFPGRAVKTALINRLSDGRIPPKNCMNCLTPCKPAEAPYCITHALIEAVKGNAKDGLFFCGANAYRMKEILNVKTLMQSLVEEADLKMEVTL